MTAFLNGVDDTNLSSVFESEAIESQFVDAIKVKYDADNTEMFDSLIIFRETLCDDPIPSSPSTIAVIAISLVIITIIVAIVGILFCKFKKKACFNLDRKVVDSKKKKDKKDLVIVSIANGAESLP